MTDAMRPVEGALGRTYSRLATLPLVVESCSLEQLRLDVSSDFTRVTTVVRLAGRGEEGVGEDVVYDPGAHDAPPPVAVEGEWPSFDSFSRHLDGVELFASPPAFEVYANYRRWAYESAALDLALRQAGTSLADALGIGPSPVTYVVSMRLGQPSLDRLHAWRRLYPGLRFKLDPTSDWDAGLIHELAELGCVDVADLKGAYRGTPVDQPPDAELYRRVAEGLPAAWIEDPDLSDPGCAAALEPHRERITWDAPIHSVADIRALPFEPRMLNIKPSRFGSVAALLEAYDFCAEHGIAMYGGGQFELGPGRGQIQYLASLFHADAPNDVAPGRFNEPVPVPGLPASPLAPLVQPRGFRWRDGGAGGAGGTLS